MKDFFSVENLEQMSDKFIDFVLKWRIPIIFLSILGAIAVGSAARNLQFSLDYKDIFNPGSPQLLAFEKLEKNYSRADNILIIVAPKNKIAFAPEPIQIVDELTQLGWKTPFSTRVDSITNFQHTEATEDDLVVRDLVPNAKKLTPEDIARIKTIALNEPLLVNGLVSPEGHVFGVNIVQSFPNKGPFEKPDSLNFIRKEIKRLRSEHPSVDFYVVGMTPLNTAFMEASQGDMMSLVPIMFAVVLITLMLLLRSLSGTLISFMIFMFSAMLAMGFAGLMGWKLNAVSASTPTIVLTMAVADCVHILASYFQYLRSGTAKLAAIRKSLKVNIGPVFVTSLTTAIGFLTMNFSDSPIFHSFGSMVAIGVGGAFVFSVTFLPAVLSLLPFKPGTARAENPRINFIADFVINYRIKILVVTTIVTLGLASLIPLNSLNDKFDEYFAKSIPFRQATDFANNNLGGTYNLDYSISSGQPDGIVEPKFQKQSADFVSWLRSQPEVVYVNTVTDTLKRLNKNLHGDDPAFYKLPDKRELAAQYLLLYEMSLPFGLDLTNQINMDKSAIRVAATLKSLSTTEMLNFEERSTGWFAQNSPGLELTAASPALMFSHIGKTNVKSMMLGTTIALILISFILMVTLRSVRMGLISLAPNLVPAAVGFGIWGYLVGEVGMSLATVSGMTLGIVVDDTVHFLSKYIRARREQGLSAEDAVRQAFSSVGIAIVVTSAVLIAGFSMLSMSSFSMNKDMGIMTAVIIASALIFDFLFLPALLVLLHGNKQPQGKSKDKAQGKSRDKAQDNIESQAANF